MKISKSQKASKVLSALLKGHTVEIADKKFVLGENYDLCQIGYTDEGQREVYMSTHIELKKFINLTDTLSDTEYATLCANLTLNGLKHDKFGWYKEM